MKDLKLSGFSQIFGGVMQYFAEAFGRIFGPDDNSYPATGVQPFEGDAHTEKAETL
ncbi:hypothetical protein [Nodosilinea nodulosa]|uniref:hypothetical protein n=1 Tax=Nodosilinea nodulosa TaxID=416001 RepID=UPI00031AFA31|nr:hypothetical protein [Nodosilinea nodulosa]